jgi:hypothetical protein
VLNGARITMGGVPDTYKKANSLTPFNNDPFAPDPNALNNLDKGGREAGENQARLLREILYRPPSGGLTVRLASNARIVLVITLVNYIPATLYFSNYNAGKAYAAKYLIETRNEFLNGPMGPGAYANVRFIACNPILVNTGGLDIYPSVPSVGPLLGAYETMPLDALAATEKNGLMSTPKEIGYSVSQVVQLSEPPTEFIASVSQSNTIGRNMWYGLLKKIWCGDTSSLDLYESFLGKEFRHPNSLIGYSNISLNGLITVPTVSLLEPVNFEDLAFTEGGQTKTLIFSGFNLDGLNMQFAYSVNAGPFIPVAVTYVPVNIPFSFVDKWITNAPVNFAMYAGQTITLTVRGTTLNAVWADGVNAKNVFTIKISIPL